jgi:uncharacterized membrane protein HdeD (DUF308 family)
MTTNRAHVMTPYRAVDLFSRSQLGRGGLLALLGIVAISFPEVALSAAMVSAGVLVVLSGAYDVSVGVASRRGFRAWPVFAAHGLACIAYGLLSIALPYVPQRTAMELVSAWLILYGLMAAALALALWPARRTRRTLLGVTMLFVPLGFVAITLVGAPAFVPSYLGAFFALFLGLLHVAAGLWLRRVAMPHFAPTAQAGWAATTER